ncbi:MAG: hypothetical protein ACUVTO_03740 [Candidatus Caldatribacteriaceae bacterium]
MKGELEGGPCALEVLSPLWGAARAMRKVPGNSPGGGFLGEEKPTREKVLSPMAKDKGVPPSLGSNRVGSFTQSIKAGVRL